MHLLYLEDSQFYSRNIQKTISANKGALQFTGNLNYFLKQALEGGWVSRLFVLSNE